MLLRRRSSAIVNLSCNDVELLQPNLRYYDVHFAWSIVDDSSVIDSENI